MKRPTRFLVLAALAVVAALGIVGAALAFSGDGDDSTASPSPGPHVSAPNDILHRIRLDAAQRAGVGPLEVRLISLTDAGWNGCLGVIKPDQACTEQFIAGFIAVFETPSGQLRYHIGGNAFAGPVNPEQASDGAPVDPEMRSDHIRLLAEYARQEVALRLDVEAKDLAIAYIVPVEFGDGCLGYAPDNARCTQLLKAEPGAVIGISVNGPLQLVSVTRNQVTWHDQEHGQTTIDLGKAVIDVQGELREDLARRLGVDAEDISVASFRGVTWPDGCLGVINPAALCLAEPAEGFLAFLTAPDGKEYRYHGGNDTFVATDFETGISGLQDPAFN